MNKFSKWDKKPIEDWGSYMSDEAKQFVKDFKSYLKRAFPGDEIIGFKPNHYDTSGFIKRGDQYIFVAYSLTRMGNYAIADYNQTGAMRGVLYRTALNEKDYSGKGGFNNFCSMFELKDSINELFERERRITKARANER